MNRWVKSSVWVSVSLVALIGYLSQREWFISVTNLWVVGFFEGACLLVVIYAFADRYGNSLAEAYCGLRELGKLSKSKDQQNSNIKHVTFSAVSYQVILPDLSLPYTE